jgi:hypothetical protein
LTPLHLAALNGREDVVRFLVSKNALISVEDAEENTPLHSAARGGHLGVVTILLDAAAAARNAVEKSVNARNKLGLTPGASALMHGHIDIANKLVAQGWDLYQPGPEKFSLLHLTAAVGRSDAVSWLIENGAGSVDDAENVDKVTPLHCAAVSGDVDTCQVLLDARADVDAVDGKNQRPFDLISSNSIEENKLRDLLKPSSIPGVVSSSSSSAPKTATGTTKTAKTTTTEASPSSRHAAFLALSQADQLRRARKWTSMHPTELSEAVESYPGASEVINRVKMTNEIKRAVEIMKAMASLRCDEEFQKDIAQRSVYTAVMILRKDPSRYDSLAQDLKVKSVVAKMGRIHAVVQANGQRTFAIEELIVPVAEIELHERKDKEMIDNAMHAMECQLAAVVAAAAASSKKEAVEEADKTMKRMVQAGQRKKPAGAGAGNIEEIQDTRDRRRPMSSTTSKEAVWRQSERETSIFDQAIADAIEDERDDRLERNWRVFVVIGVLTILWIFSLMHRWGYFTRKVDIKVDITIDGEKVEL